MRCDGGPFAHAPNCIRENGDCTVTVRDEESVFGHSASSTAIVQVTGPVTGSMSWCMSHKQPHDSEPDAGHAAGDTGTTSAPETVKDGHSAVT
jgi:hypothetical protein